MNKIILFIIVFLIIGIFISDKISFFSGIKETNVYKDAYDLGNKYLSVCKKSNYFDLQYPAVMFDIDDTLIDYSGKPIKNIIKLLNKCISQKLIVIIITARADAYKEETIQQLEANDIKYGALFLRSANDDINTFKSNIKKKLAEQSDITTIMSIGDNIIDIDGEYSGYWIKLPNNNDHRLYHLNADGESEQIV